MSRQELWRGNCQIAARYRPTPPWRRSMVQAPGTLRWSNSSKADICSQGTMILPRTLWSMFKHRNRLSSIWCENRKTERSMLQNSRHQSVYRKPRSWMTPSHHHVTLATIGRQPCETRCTCNGRRFWAQLAITVICHRLKLSTRSEPWRWNR